MGFTGKGCNRTHTGLILRVSLLLLGQIGLFVHQAEHHLKPDLMASDECASCAFSSAMSGGDEPVIAIAPQVNFVIEQLTAQIVTAPKLTGTSAPFRSRGPPATVLI